MPSVSWLIARHKLDSIINSIPTSGPKGQHLKGDILLYLAGHPAAGDISDIDTMLRNEMFYEVKVDLRKAVEVIKGTGGLIRFLIH